MLYSIHHTPGGDVASHEAPPCHPPARRPIRRERDACCCAQAMSAGAHPASFTIEQWEELLPLPPVQTGALVQIKREGFDEYLIGAVVDSDEFEAIIAPLTSDAEFAAEWDLLVDPTALGWPAAIQVWNTGAALLEQIDAVLATLARSDIERLDAVYEASLHGSRDAVPLEWTGPSLIAEDDPRLLHDEEELEAARPFYLPATVLADAGTLPALVQHQAERRGLALDTLDDRLASFSHTDLPLVTRLVEGALDLHAEMPPKALYGLLSDLDVPLGRRSLAMVHDEAYRTVREGLATQAVLARRRAGVRPRAPRASSEDRRKAAYSYASALAGIIRS